MKTIYSNLILLLVAVFIFGCSSPQVQSEKTRSVSQSSAPEDSNQGSAHPPFIRKYEDSISCKLVEQPTTTAFEREKVSALTGFAVGPQAATYASDLSKPILRPFTSDGCSSSPDGVPLTENSSVWMDCCIRHDTSYWMGGTRDEKKKADEELRSCMAGKGYPNIGKMYKSFVSEFGGPSSAQSYRWGYGWNYKRSYSEITEQENIQIKRLYNVDKNHFSDFMMAQSFPLQKICDPADPIFYGLRKEEVAVYNFLNSRLQKPDVITWARLRNFNQVGYTYEVKLQSCVDPVYVTLYEDAKKASEFKSSCGL